MKIGRSRVRCLKAKRALVELARSPHIHLALVSGGILIVLTLISKKVLTEPIDDIYFTLPALLLLVGETTLKAKRRLF